MGKDVRFERLQNLITAMLELRGGLECLQLSNIPCWNARLLVEIANSKDEEQKRSGVVFVTFVLNFILLMPCARIISEFSCFLIHSALQRNTKLIYAFHTSMLVNGNRMKLYKSRGCIITAYIGNLGYMSTRRVVETVLR